MYVLLLATNRDACIYAGCW